MGPDSLKYDEECTEQLIEHCKPELVPHLRTLPSVGEKFKKVLAWACVIEKRVENHPTPPVKIAKE
jgi:hypothetical protein